MVVEPAKYRQNTESHRRSSKPSQNRQAGSQRRIQVLRYKIVRKHRSYDKRKIDARRERRGDSEPPPRHRRYRSLKMRTTARGDLAKRLCKLCTKQKLKTEQARSNFFDVFEAHTFSRESKLNLRSRSSQIYRTVDFNPPFFLISPEIADVFGGDRSNQS